MKKIIIFILSLTMFILIPANCDAKEDEEIVAKSSILMCMDTGDIIKENNAYEHLSPASVTKIMTILLVMEAIERGDISLDDMVAATEEAVSMGGSQIWLEVGEEMSVDDLLKAVIIASANDACTLLSEYVAGSKEAFVDLMNEKVKELGLENTNFENCTGLDDDTVNHYSCAYDLAVIATQVMKYDIVTNYSTVWLDSLRGDETELNNTNKLVNTYNGITGLKTGTTSIAGFCLCATAYRNSMNLVSVVLGAQTSDDRFNLASDLLDYGFSNYQLSEISVDKNQITSVKVKNGIEKSIKPTVNGDTKILTKKGSDEFNYEYVIKKSVKAPVKKGDELGYILVTSANEEVATVKLTASKDIRCVNFSYIFFELIQNI